nr:hypothetical protein [Rhodococcus erythropolis]
MQFDPHNPSQLRIVETCSRRDRGIRLLGTALPIDETRLPRVETFPHKDGTIVQRGPSVPLVGEGIRGVRAAAGLPTERPEVRRLQGFATPVTATLGAFGRTERKACACLSGRRRLFVLPISPIALLAQLSGSASGRLQRRTPRELPGNVA